MRRDDNVSYHHERQSFSLLPLRDVYGEEYATVKASVLYFHEE